MNLSARKSPFREPFTKGKIASALAIGKQLEVAAIDAARRNGAALWYVPDNLEGVYQDSSGTSLAVLNGPVGLLLDHSYGAASLGAELISNGKFDTDINGWISACDAGGSVGWDSTGALALINSTGTARARIFIAAVPGKIYRVQARNAGNTGIAMYCGNTSGGVEYLNSVSLAIGVGTVTRYVTATAETMSFDVRNFGAGTTALVDDISIREVVYGANTYGAELLTNGNGSNGTVDWSAAYQSTIANVGGRIRVTALGGTNPYIQHAIIPVEVGKTYRLRGTVYRETSAGGVTLALFASPSSSLADSTYGSASTSNGDVMSDFVFVATGPNLYIRARHGTTSEGTYFSLSDISVVEVTGVHATQTTTANKPTLVRVPRRFGPELIADPTFDNPAQWSARVTSPATAIVSGGVATINSPGGEFASLDSTSLGNIIPGRQYQITCDVAAVTGNGVRVDVGGTVGQWLMSAMSYTLIVTATTSQAPYVARAGGVSSGTVTRCSVREVLEWSYALSFDGASDHLRTTAAVGGVNDFTLIAAGAHAGPTANNNYMIGEYSQADENRAYVGMAASFLPGGGAGNVYAGLLAAPSGPFTPGAPRVLSVTRGATTATLYDAGVQVDSEIISTSGGTPLAVMIGAAANVNIPGSFWNGSVALSCACPSNMPAADRRAIERFAAYLTGVYYV